VSAFGLPDMLQRYQDRFARLIVNVRGGRASPHKICMLLAVLDLAMAGGLRENLVRYAPALLERYRRCLHGARRERDHAKTGSFGGIRHSAGAPRGVPVEVGGD